MIETGFVGFTNTVVVQDFNRSTFVLAIMGTQFASFLHAIEMPRFCYCWLGTTSISIL
jgi:hypothetical protein